MSIEFLAEGEQTMGTCFVPILINPASPIRSKAAGCGYILRQRTAPPLGNLPATGDAGIVVMHSC